MASHASGGERGTAVLHRSHHSSIIVRQFDFHKPHTLMTARARLDQRRQVPRLTPQDMEGADKAVFKKAQRSGCRLWLVLVPASIGVDTGNGLTRRGTRQVIDVPAVGRCAALTAS